MGEVVYNLNIRSPIILRKLTFDYQLQQLEAIQQELDDVIQRLTKFRDSRSVDDPRIADINEAVNSLQGIHKYIAEEIQEISNNQHQSNLDINQLSLNTIDKISQSLRQNIFEKPTLKEAYGFFEMIITVIINFINRTNESAVDIAVKPLSKYAELSTHGSDKTIADSFKDDEPLEDDKHSPRSNSMR